MKSGQLWRLENVIGNVLDMLQVKNLNRERLELLTEIRLRVGRRIQLRYSDGEELLAQKTEAKLLSEVLSSMMEYSVYAWENELREGFFTLEDGCRVGVCGRYAVDDGKIESLIYIGSVCIRNAREIKGCAQKIDSVLKKEAGNVLILSPPGMGKTTILRDAARLMSEKGMNVAIADERSELAACRKGKPFFDVGERTDVADGCPKAIAMAQIIRSCAPDALVTDEIGGEEDAAAILDAARCGIKMVVSAHASNFAEAEQRPALSAVLKNGIFSYVVVLGGFPGNLKEIRPLMQ